ncbi:MAG TPA: hypothetical protein VLG16_01895 [Candidatus Saccharimonadales bacterium]|nr:hypothetical protein [Candidatus Saccharimonadales bacterium]
MTPRQTLILLVFCAVAMGFISGKLLLFNGSAMNVLPWSILAFGASFLAVSKRQSIKFSATFSFVVSFSFLLFNDANINNLAQLLKLILAACVASSFGLLGGVLLGWLGWKARHGFKRNRGDQL